MFTNEEIVISEKTPQLDKIYAKGQMEFYPKMYPIPPLAYFELLDSSNGEEYVKHKIPGHLFKDWCEWKLHCLHYDLIVHGETRYELTDETLNDLSDMYHQAGDRIDSLLAPYGGAQWMPEGCFIAKSDDTEEVA